MKKSLVNIQGQKFGRVMALQPSNERQNGHVLWDCICDCGTRFRASSNNLKTGSTTSCGCYRSEVGRARKGKPMPRRKKEDK